MPGGAAEQDQSDGIVGIIDVVGSLIVQEIVGPTPTEQAQPESGPGIHPCLEGLDVRNVLLKVYVLCHGTAGMLRLIKENTTSM